MAELFYCDELPDELDKLAISHSEDVALIDALIEELNDDPSTLEALTQGTPKWLYDYKPPFEIKRFEECWGRGYCIYILKLYDADGHLSDFRTLIAHDVHTDDYFVLSVQPRTTSYAKDSPAFRSLLDRYERLQIPTHGQSR